MKRTLCVLLTLCFSVLLFASCGNTKEIKTIVINGVEYNSLYIYSFEDAEIIDDYSILYKTEVDKPDSNGYVCSSERLNIGDDIVVWEQFFFDYPCYDNKNSLSSSDIKHCTAKVSGLENEYLIDLKEKGDRYTITCYRIIGNKCDTELERIESKSLEKIVVDVPKDDVVIEYYE